MGESTLAEAHGLLMMAAWLFLAQFAEVIGWWASCKTGFSRGYYKVMENGHRIFNVHTGFNICALAAGVAAVACILVTSEFKEALVSNEGTIDRHVIYGASFLGGILLHFVGAVVVPRDKYPAFVSVHKWWGRLMNLYAFNAAYTGFTLAIRGTNADEGTDQARKAGSDALNGVRGNELVMVLFILWGLVKLLICGYYIMTRRCCCCAAKSSTTVLADDQQPTSNGSTNTNTQGGSGLALEAGAAAASMA